MQSKLTQWMLIICMSGLLSSCAYTKGGIVPRKGPEVAIRKVSNYTEYPYGEEILSGMLRSVLLDHNKKIMAAEATPFAIEADLNEFKYKEGVAGEGAASVTVRLYKAKRLIQSETSSKSGFGRESVAEILHKCLRHAVGKLKIK